MLRYQRKSIVNKYAGVSTIEGLDPLTGLAVLIYEFTGKVSPHLLKLESENMAGILDIEEGEKTQVVTAYFKDYRPLRKPLRIDSKTLLLDSARALRDASKLAIVHGDIKPGRFLATDKHVIIEGFGIPWKLDKSTYRIDGEPRGAKADVYAWGRSVLELANDLPKEVVELLNSCVAVDPNKRPKANRIYDSLVELLKPKKPTLDTLELSATGESGLINDFDDAERRFGEKAGYLNIDSEDTPKLENSTKRVTLKSKPAQRSKVNSMMPMRDKPRPEAAKRVERGKVPGIGRPKTRESAQTKANKQTGFIRGVPPGTKYKEGDSYNEPRSKNFLDEFDIFDENVKNKKPNNRRGFIALMLVFLIAAAIAGYSAFRNRQTQVIAAEQVSRHYIVDVEVLPDNLPPVEIVVISSPSGSANKANTILQTVSGKQPIVLDKEGVWELQGRFQNSVSEIVKFSLPEDRHVTITMKPNTP